MIEYSTKAVVLKRVPKGDFDEVITLYTKDMGKISARAKGIRKITSKLSGHLQVGSLVTARLLRKTDIQLIDAFSHRSGLTGPLHRFLLFIEAMTHHDAPDLHFWYGVEYAVENSVFVSGPQELRNRVYRRFLDILGFGSKFAKCGNCGDGKIAYFLPSDIMFLCSNSMKKVASESHEVVEI